MLPIVVACLCPVSRAQDEVQAPRRASSAHELVSREKSSPTTAKNARARYEELVKFVRQSGNHDRYMRRQTAMRIRALLQGGQGGEAAKLVHTVILDLETGRPDEEDGGFEPRGPDGPSSAGRSRRSGSAPQDSGGAGRGDTRALERIVGEEKRLPTTEETVKRRHRALIRAALGTGVPIRYLSPGKMAPVDELLAQGDLAGAAAELHMVILGVGSRLSSGGDAAQTPTARSAEAEVPSAPTTADKASASVLYFKAMQEYADGKADRAWDFLQSGVKLDPSNQDIAKAIARLSKER